MPGPSTVILSPRPLDRAVVTAIIESVAEMFRERDFWVDGLPFGSYYGADYPDELADYTRDDFAPVVGWIPADLFGCYAITDDPDSHRILAALAVRIARTGDGIIDLDTLLPLTPTLPGTLHQVPYRTKPGTRHCCDADYLEAWANHPDFRLGK
jgi:hypothetical protein